jgi:hypothetical protein
VSIAPTPAENRLESLHPFPEVEPPRAWRLRIAGVCIAIILVVACTAIVEMPLAFQIYFGALAVPFAAFAVCLLMRAGRLRMVLSENGIEYRGLVRDVAVQWSDVEWVGWISALPSPVDPLGYRLAFKTRDRRLPFVILWLDESTIAKTNSVSSLGLRRMVKHAVEDRGVRFRERIPDMSPTAVSWCQMAAGAVLFIAVPLLLAAALR